MRDKNNQCRIWTQYEETQYNKNKEQDNIQHNPALRVGRLSDVLLCIPFLLLFWDKSYITFALVIYEFS